MKDAKYIEKKKNIDDLLKKGKITEEQHKNMLLDLEESLVKEKLKKRAHIEKLFQDGKISKKTYENMLLDLEEPAQSKENRTEKKKGKEKIIDSKKKKKLKLLKKHRVNPSFYEHQDIKKIDEALDIAKDIKKIEKYKKNIPKSIYNTIKSESEEIYLMLTATDIPAARKRIDELIEKCVETKVKIDAIREEYKTIKREMEIQLKNSRDLPNIESIEKEFNDLVSQIEDIFLHLEKYEFEYINKNISKIEILNSRIEAEKKRFAEFVNTLRACKIGLNELERLIATRVDDETLLEKYKGEYTDLYERLKTIDQSSELSKIRKLQDEILKKNHEIKNIKTLKSQVYENDVFKKYVKLLDTYEVYGFSVNCSKFDDDIKKITSEESKNKLLERIKLENKELEKKISEASRIYNLITEFENFSFENFPETVNRDIENKFSSIVTRFKKEKLEGLYDELKELIQNYKKFKNTVLPIYKEFRKLESEVRNAVNNVQNMTKNTYFKEKFSSILETINSKGLDDANIYYLTEDLKRLRDEIKIYSEEEKTEKKQIKEIKKEVEALLGDINKIKADVISFGLKKEVIDQIQKKISYLKGMIGDISIESWDIVKAQAIKAEVESFKVVLEERVNIYLDFLECQHILKELEDFSVKKESLKSYEENLKNIETIKEKLFMLDYHVGPISSDVKELKKDLKKKRSILELKDLEIRNIKSKLIEMNIDFRAITISNENFENEIEENIKEYRNSIITMNEEYIQEAEKKIEELNQKIEKKLKNEIRKYLVLIEKIKGRGEDISGYDAILKKSSEIAEKFEFEDILERINKTKTLEGKKLICPYCGEKIKTGVNHCPECGEKIVWCPKCNTPNTKDSKFCIKDGYLLQPEKEIKKILEKKGIVLLGDLKGLSEKSAREKLKEFYEKYKNEMTIFFENDVLGTGKEEKMIECPKCNTSFSVARGTCPQCGWAVSLRGVENKIKKTLEEWGSVTSDFEDLKKVGCTDEHVKLFYEKYKQNAKDTLGFEIELLEDGTLIKK